MAILIMKNYNGRTRCRTQVQLEMSDLVTKKESVADKTATAQGVAKANHKPYKETNIIKDEQAELDLPLQVPEDSSELFVITKVKKLAAYVITVTEKSPKRFRAVFVNRMQNYCLDCLEYLIEANSLRLDNTENIRKRKDCQHNAYMKLKLLGYMSFLSLESECILKKQYEQISLQVADSINLLVAWRRSDANRIGK